MKTITARIIDGAKGERILALMDGLTILWRCATTELDAGRIVEGAAQAFRRFPGAGFLMPDGQDVWRAACLHVLPLDRQAKATGGQVRSYVSGLISNGRAVAALGLDDGAGEAWADRAGSGPLLESKPDSLPWGDGLPAVERALLGLRWKRGHGILLAGDEGAHLAVALADLRTEVDQLKAANSRLQDQLSGHAAGPVLTMCDKVTELRAEIDELKRALDLARAAVAAPVADPPADAPALASPPDPADVYNSRLANAMTLLDHAKAHLVAARADAPAGTFDSNRMPAGMRLAEVDVVFDGPPGPEAGRFVEVEEGGRSIATGEWVAPAGDPALEDDPFWRLRLKVLLPAGRDASATG